MLELASGVAGPLCGRLFADYGADVIKVERGNGDPARRWPPFAPGVSTPESGGYFLNLNRNKRGIVLDPGLAHDREKVLHLARKWADAVVVDETFLGDFSPSELASLGHSLVVCAISPFGLTGPLAGAPSTDLTALASGGLLYLTGDPDREPVQISGQQALQISGLNAAYHLIAALSHVWATGEGQLVDVSHQESVTAVLELGAVEYSYHGKIPRRNGVRHPSIHGMGRPRLADGTYVFAGTLPELRMWEAVVDFLGSEALRAEEYRSGRRRLQVADTIDALVQKAIASRTVDEVFRPLQAQGVPVTPVVEPHDAIKSPQLAARGFFVSTQHPATGEVRLLGPVAKLPASPGSVRRPAPLLGQHTDEVIREIEQNRMPSKDRFATGSRREQAGNRVGPLQGFRILDLSWVWAGPMCAGLLAQMGAEVIKVESTRRLDLGRNVGPFVGDPHPDGSGFYHLYNRGKRSITINLRDPQGIEVVRRLAGISDLVVENFSAGTLDRLGLGHAELAKRNAAIVVLSMPGIGLTGPDRRLLTYGQNIEALSGMMATTGYSDRGPGRPGITYGDPVSAYAGAFTSLVALRHARQTGIGQQIDLGQIEATMSVLTGPIMEAILTGASKGRQGNRSSLYAPHDVFRCEGDDRWVAIVAQSDDAWQRLARMIGRQDLGDRYPALADRQQAVDEIEVATQAWVSSLPPDQVVEQCRKNQIAASLVLDGRDLALDLQLTSREFFVSCEEPEAGIKSLQGVVPMSATPGGFHRPSPRLGQHTREVLAELLGLTKVAIDGLESAGVLE